MQPQDFCDLAQRLLTSEPIPAGYRSAISRAYYGAYLQAVTFLSQVSVHLVSGNPHKEVVDLLADTGDTSVDEAGALLANLREDRNTADYNLTRKDVETHAKADQCVNDALEIIAILNGCRLNPTRLATVQAKIQSEASRLRGLPPPASSTP